MRELFNVYCDESGHLENDHQQVMVLGAVWIPSIKSRNISVGLREIKKRHGLASDFEIKWTKVSPAQEIFYIDVLDFFFNQPDLHLRALVVPDKSMLRHQDFNQSHDEWYYKMYFTMLRAIFNPDNSYRIYIDHKDTLGAAKVRKLHQILCSSINDLSCEIISQVQEVRSHEVAILQMTDLLIGAVGYANRQLSGSVAKQALVQHIQEKTGYSLTGTTPISEKKINILRWQAREEEK